MLENSKNLCHHKFNSRYHKNKLCHFILEKIKFCDITINIIYRYMAWFKQIPIKEYDDLIKNKNKMYNIIPHFTSPELLNEYRNDDDNINKKIEYDEKLNKQNENLSKAINKNLNKYLNEKTDISKYNGHILLKMMLIF